jgi:hypothetical protein
MEKMKYIELVNSGNCINHNNCYYIVTSDFKKNGQRLCISITDGSSRWLEPNTMIEIIQLFYTDKDNNIVPFIETKKDDINNY